MKVLMFGLGSIGQRHVRMLQALNDPTIEIGAYRSRKLNWLISDKLEADLDKDPCEHYGIRCFHDIEEAFAWKPDVAFITNPISMHVDTAILAAKHGCHLMIEKPLGSNDSNLNELVELITKKNLKCLVGYQTRFHPAYQRIKQIISDGGIGELANASLHFGEWLPGMHPYEDYRISHAAKKEQGGGVILCLSHEIDLACWLFGQPQSAYCSGGHLSSDLELENVEDTANIILNFSNSRRTFPVNIHLDFLQKPAKRNILIIGSKGKIEFNYHTNEFKHYKLPDGKLEETTYKDFQRNDMFKSEVSNLLESIRNDTEVLIPLDEGIRTLKVCLACKASLESGNLEYIHD